MNGAHTIYGTFGTTKRLPLRISCRFGLQAHCGALARIFRISKFAKSWEPSRRWSLSNNRSHFHSSNICNMNFCMLILIELMDPWIQHSSTVQYMALNNIETMFLFKSVGFETAKYLIQLCVDIVKSIFIKRAAEFCMLSFPDAFLSTTNIPTSNWCGIWNLSPDDVRSPRSGAFQESTFSSPIDCEFFILCRTIKDNCFTGDNLTEVIFLVQKGSV